MPVLNQQCKVYHKYENASQWDTLSTGQKKLTFLFPQNKAKCTHSDVHGEAVSGFKLDTDGG